YGSNALEIVDISDPTNPTHAGNLSDGVGGAQLTDPADVYVSGNYAYIVSDTDDALEIVDISDPTNPTHAASFSDGVILNRPMNLYISGKYAYITSFSNNSLEIVDISGIDAPAANIGALESSTITVTENADIGNNLYVRNGINVGPAGIKSDGVIVASSLESTAGIKIGNTTTTNAGTIRWTGSDFEGYNGSSWGSLSHTLPAGTIIFFNGTSCPTGFNELTTARGRAIVGLPSSGTLGGTVDTAYSNLEDRTHNHTTQGHTLTIAEMPSHTHTTDLMLNTSKSGGVGWPVGTEGSSTITYPTGGSGSHDHGNTTSNSANIPYIQFLVCIKT
ncbi:hypothetical protein GOV08_01765, partial [Candidatus Woesearchaeota archaeon]|nr:hypothetical protein [Candidatus Woesearchaeota archaeon]